MATSSFPDDILTAIFKLYELQYSDTYKKGEFRFLPKWYLLPLLRVCRSWHMVFERRLYRCISIGRRFNHGKRTGRVPPAPARRRFETAKALLATLSTNTRLAALVEELRLGITDAQHDEAPAWTRTHARLLLVCPNLTHVVIRGFAPCEHDALAEALKESSLVSFRISPHGLAFPESRAVASRAGPPFRLFDVLPSWPNLQTLNTVGFAIDTQWSKPSAPCAGIWRPLRLDELWQWLPRHWTLNVAGLPRSTEWAEPSVIQAQSAFDAFGAACCCSQLQDIRFIGNKLQSTDFKTLRTMCGSVTRLYVGTHDWGGEYASLCECLRAWPSTLECVSLRFDYSQRQSPLLFEALSTLNVLQELQIHGLYPLFRPIAHLTQLKRLCFATLIGFSENEIGFFCGHLDDQNMFASLTHVVLHLGREREVMLGGRLRNDFLRRGIKLERWNGRRSILGFLL